MHWPACLIFVVPLVMATCAVAVLNGNVVCIAGGEHVAVEARHDGDCHHAGEGHQEQEHRPVSKSCSDVSADFDLSRAADRTDAVDPPTVQTPHLWDSASPATAAFAPAASYLPRSTAAPPAGDRTAPGRTIILII